MPMLFNLPMVMCNFKKNTIQTLQHVFKNVPLFVKDVEDSNQNAQFSYFFQPLHCSTLFRLDTSLVAQRHSELSAFKVKGTSVKVSMNAGSS